jgi:hypothetical protein
MMAGNENAEHSGSDAFGFRVIRLPCVAGNVLLCHETSAAPSQAALSGETGLQNCCCEIPVKGCRRHPLGALQIGREA